MRLQWFGDLARQDGDAIFANLCRRAPEFADIRNRCPLPAKSGIRASASRHRTTGSPSAIWSRAFLTAISAFRQRLKQKAGAPVASRAQPRPTKAMARQ